MRVSHGLFTISVAILLTVPATAMATGVGKQLNDAVIQNYSSSGSDPLQYSGGVSRLPNGHVDSTLTLGDAIQGGFYGNAANTAGTHNGHGTLPSLAPGPKVCSPSCSDPSQGASWGDVKKVYNPSALGLVGQP